MKHVWDLTHERPRQYETGCCVTCTLIKHYSVISDAFIPLRRYFHLVGFLSFYLYFSEKLMSIDDVK